MLHIRPAQTVDLPGIAIVLHDAFSEKMRVIFGKNPETAHTLLEAMYAGPVQRGYDGILVAERGGRIVGTLAIEPVYYTSHENRSFEYMVLHELGLLGMLRAAFCLWLISHTPDPDEAYVGDVGVVADARGEGIGRQLMEGAEQWAVSHNRARLTLWVATTNHRAIHVYEQAGYRVVKKRSSLLIRLAFGIRQWYFMEKPLNR